jgi:hypothetical protein
MMTLPGQIARELSRRNFYSVIKMTATKPPARPQSTEKSVTIHGSVNPTGEV